ncbi:hypothetical protein F53441_7334 [Fusarium austroafricanum]|uniref:Uncharacterized protein n=1 Tax=Fusarium austroafricanum TaxID=2364996 RepID=A0A8H4NVL4_9HYPO|nr:hypothetical protein F53441_7334 [Fusarium austroafricanum]
MSLFGNLLDGVKSAGQWAIDHSGNITPALAAVSRAAGILFSPDGSIQQKETLLALTGDTDQQNLANFSKTFTFVSHQLAVKAVNAVVRNSENVKGMSGLVQDSVVGLWRYPTGLSHNGEPSTSMYQDLSAIMGSMNIPVSWTDSSGKTNDTVNDIGKALFASTSLEGLSPLLESENPIVTVLAEAPTQDGIIHAAHVYYPIPMGKSTLEYSLHSAICIKCTTNKDAQALSAAQDHFTMANTPVDEDSWLVTLNITWASAPVATSQAVQSKFQEIISKSYSALSLVASRVIGTLQTVKIQTQASQSPAYAQAAVQAAATAAVNDTGTDDNAPHRNAVPVVVTDSTWFPKAFFEANIEHGSVSGSDTTTK